MTAEIIKTADISNPIVSNQSEMLIIELQCFEQWLVSNFIPMDAKKLDFEISITYAQNDSNLKSNWPTLSRFIFIFLINDFSETFWSIQWSCKDVWIKIFRK